jgi:hypothetical protein
MVADKRWKFIHSEGPGHRPILFDMETDPEEFHDLGASPAHAEVIALMYERLGQWARRMSQRTTCSDAQILAGRGASRRKGILLGLYDGSEVAPDMTAHLGGPAAQDFTLPHGAVRTARAVPSPRATEARGPARRQ